MYLPPLVLSRSRFSWDTMPASPTKTHRLSCHPFRSSLTCATVLTSTVLPGNTQCRTGKPSRVTASPITICGAEIERVFYPIFIGFEHIHGAVEMVQIEQVRSLNADILTQPLLITVEFGTGRTRPIGPHSKERPFDR